MTVCEKCGNEFETAYIGASKCLPICDDCWKKEFNQAVEDNKEELLNDLAEVFAKYENRVGGMNAITSLSSRFHVGSTTTRMGSVYVGFVNNNHGRNKLGSQVINSRVVRS